MHEPWLAALKAGVNGARALADVRQIARHHRIQASPGYDDAAAWLVDAATAAGLVVEVEHVPGDGRTNVLGCVLPEGWDCERAGATLVDARGATPIADWEPEPLSLIQRSASARGRYPLVSVPDGTRGEHYDGVEVRGKVVLTAGAVQRVHELAVVERGAAGLLSFGRRLVPPARTREHDRESLAYTSFWWAGDAPRGWGFVVSPARGEALAARLAAGEALALDVEIASRRFATRIPLVTATLPGAPAAEVMLTAHLCHPRPGANDNASGVAATLEAMRALAALARAGGLPPERRTIRALWMPEFTGTYAWLAGGSGRASRTLAALNLDMVGEDQSQCGSTQQIERSPHFAAGFADQLLAPVRFAARAAAYGPDADGVRIEHVRYSGGSDHAVWLDPALGVPCALLIQWPDRYYHSNLDAPERCDPRALAHAALTAATWAATLACADAGTLVGLGALVERTARRELRAALDAQQPQRAVRAALHRAHGALASLDRLRLGAGAAGPVRADVGRVVEAATEAIEGVRVAEVEPAQRAACAGLPAAPGGGTVCRRVPVRLQQAPLVLPRALQAGWAALSPVDRERLVELERSLPGGSTTLDLAWFACDGTRTVDGIAERLGDEGETVAADMLAEWFELIAALGASGWREEAH